MQSQTTTQRFSLTYAGRSDDRVVRFSVSECVDDVRPWTVDIATETGGLDLSQLRLKPACLTLHSSDGRALRYFYGLVTGLEYLGKTQRYRQYKLTLTNAFGLLQYRRCNRIYQNQDVQAIIEDVFKQAGIPKDQIDFNLQGKAKPRIYCVQYQESDWQFIQRLCQEEGWYHWLKHDDQKYKIHIANHRNAHTLLEPKTVAYHDPSSQVATTDDGKRQAHIYAFHPQQSIGYEAISLQDFSYNRPTQRLEGRAKAGDGQGFQNVEYPGYLTDQDSHEQRARVMLDAEFSHRNQHQGESDHPTLQAGGEFDLIEHPNSKNNQSYFIAEITHFGEQPQALGEDATSQPTRYFNSFSCITADQPYRNRIARNKPQITGYQTARVVGPDGEKLYTDEHGRIKVRFHWDNSDETNERNSCWIRVMQSWAGSAYGSFILPRIDQEVVVQFENGDPDRPLVTGTVFSGVNRAPLDLPTQKTQTVMRTQLVGEEGYHEIRIEDQADKASIAIESGKDWTRYVKNDSKTFIGNEHHLVIKKDQIEQVDGDKHQNVKGTVAQKFEKNVSLDIGADLQIQTKDITAMEAANELHFKSGKKIIIEDGAEITIKVGGNFLKIDSSGVTVVGSKIKLNSGGSAGKGKAVKVLKPKKVVKLEPGKAGKSEKVESKGGEKVSALAIPAATASSKKNEDTKEENPKEEKKLDLHIERYYHDDEPLQGAEFTVRFADGSERSGKLDSNGKAVLKDVPPGEAQIQFGPDSRPYERVDQTKNEKFGQSTDDVIKRYENQLKKKK